MKDILSQLDTKEIRSKVFKLYDLPQMSQSDLVKAYYTYMID